MMRELNSKEIQNVTGGIDPSFFYGAIRGAAESNLDNTIENCLIFGAIAGGLIGLTSFPPIGLIIGIPAGAIIEGTLGYVGYAIGNFITH